MPDVPAGRYTVTETDPWPGHVLSEVECSGSSTGDAETGEATIDLAADATVTCTFTNLATAGLEVTKLTGGVVDPTSDWTFEVFEGREGFGGSALGADSTVIAYDPNAADDPPEGLGNRCFDVGAGTAYPTTPGGTVSLEVDNRIPVVDPRTPGYWKNWNTCTPGRHADTAAKNGGPAAGWFLLDDILTDPGIAWADFAIDSCDGGVSVLDQRDERTNRKRANDAAYTLAMHLLAAQLDFAAGAEVCPAAQAASTAGQALLERLRFDGTGKYLRPRDRDYDEALELAEVLDRYNNGELCS